RGELAPTHVLHFANGTTLTARELAHASALDGKRLADPQEPNYRYGDDATFHWRSGDWRIGSWAHGTRKVYQLIKHCRARAGVRPGTNTTIPAKEVPPWH